LQTDKHTDKQADAVRAILHTSIGGTVKTPLIIEILATEAIH